MGKGTSSLGLTTETALADCGTTACAVGWACLDPKMQSEGLSYTLQSGYFDDIVIIPTFDGETGWDAVESFFGLTCSLCEQLFLEDSYSETYDEDADNYVISTEDVMKRIAIVIENHDSSESKILKLIEGIK